MGERTDQAAVFEGWIPTLGFSIFIVAGIMLFVTFNDSRLRSICLIAMGAALVLIAFAGYRRWRVRQALGTAELKFDDRVPLGFSGTATYFRPVHGAEMRSIEARLQCEEEIEQGSRRNKGRVTKIVHDEVLTPTVTPMMERIEVRIPVKIPTTGPPTFQCSTAETRWWLRLRLKMSGCPNTTSSFAIEVVPGLAHR